MAYRIGKREFDVGDLRAVFRTLDGGGTRDDVRRVVKLRQEGRGVSNDTIKGLRELHRRLRRSQGYNVKVGGTRNLIDPNTGQLRRLDRLPARKKVAPSRRPSPPKIEGARTRVTVERPVVDSRGRPIGSRVDVFRADDFQIGELGADTTDVEGTFYPGAPRSRRPVILQVRSEI